MDKIAMMNFLHQIACKLRNLADFIDGFIEEIYPDDYDWDGIPWDQRTEDKINVNVWLEQPTHPNGRIHYWNVNKGNADRPDIGGEVITMKGRRFIWTKEIDLKALYDPTEPIT